MNEEKLREILRTGDPAAGDGGLAPEEVQAMRRAVLSAVPEPRRRGWLVPALAGASALIVAAVVVLSFLRPESVETARLPEPSPPLPPSPTAPSPSLGEGGAVREKAVAQEREEAPFSRGGVRGGGRGDGGEGPPAPATAIARIEPPPAPSGVLTPEPAAQTQIQFSTPGGTRIIWVLQPATE